MKKTFYLWVDRPTSVNRWVRCGKSKSGVPYAYKTREARDYEKELLNELEKNYPNVKNLGKIASVEIYHIEFIFIGNIREDVSNLVKITEDAFSRFIGIDDRSWNSIKIQKIKANLDKVLVIIKMITR